MDNIVKAAFTRNRAKTRPVFQYDYGMVLQIVGVDLPTSYEVHFGNAITGNAFSVIGDESGVSIPDILLEGSGTVYAWLYLHTGANDGETVYVAEIPVTPRAKPTHETPSPVQQSEIEQAIAALNSAVEAADGAATEAANSAQDAEDAYNAILAVGLVAAADGEGNVTITLGGTNNGGN